MNSQDELFWARRAAARKADVAAYERVLRELVEAIEDFPGAYIMPPANASCHTGIVPQERCVNCQRISRRILALNGARNLLKLAEKPV